MAVFSGSTLDSINSISDKKVQSYLYKLNEDLEYMFNNLNPDDNYSETARLIYAENKDAVSNLEVSVDGIFANYLKGDSLVASLNLDSSGVKIKGEKITLEGVVTANNYFRINADGSMTCTNGTFSGTLTSNTLNAATINGATINTSCSISCGDEFYITNRNDQGDAELIIGDFDIESSIFGRSYECYVISSAGAGYPYPLKLWANGIIVAQDIMLKNGEGDDGSSWWDDWSIYQIIRAMWDCMKAKGWNPGAYDPWR